MVREAELRAEMPPLDMPLRSFGGYTQQPGMEDLRAVLYLHHQANCLELALFNEPRTWVRPEHKTRVGPFEEEPDQMPEWRGAGTRAIYRTLAVAAALAGVYSEPLFEARKSQEPDLLLLAEMEEVNTSTQRAFLEVSYLQPRRYSRGGRSRLWSHSRLAYCVYLFRQGGTEEHAKRFEQRIGRAKCCRDIVETRRVLLG